MTNKRKAELLDLMYEYIAEFLGNDEEFEEAEEEITDYYDAARYIEALVGRGDVIRVLKEIIGFTDEELEYAGFDIEED